jgi:ketosteroid isomerase-like protein
MTRIEGDAKRRVVRDFYAARHRRDWTAVGNLLAAEVVWREADGDADYAGDHYGRAAVVELLAKFVEITGGTFTLEPRELISTAEHVATTVRWRAERSGTPVEGNDLAVYRIADGQIAEAWFFPDGYEPQALSRVFSFAPTTAATSSPSESSASQATPSRGRTSESWSTG